MNDLKQTFGERLREARKGKGLNQTQLGEFLGVSAPSVSAYETNDANPTMASLAIITDKLGVTTDWLITGKNPTTQYSTDRIDNGIITESGHVDLTLVKQVIEAVAEHLQNNDLDMPPTKIAELVEVLYEEITESTDKQINRGTVARMIKLAL